MEELDIGQLLGYFKSKIIYIIFAMSIAFCLSSIYVNRFRVPEYTSYTTILLNKTNETINSTDVSLNRSLVTTYGEIIKSKKVLREVISNLGLELNYSQLAGKVNVSELTDTSIIKITVTDKNSQEAANIANEIATVFAKDIVEIYNIENISIIDVAELAESASSTSTIKIIGTATIAGAFISIVIMFITFYFDTTLKNEEDIEKLTGLPVIGIVPISREKIKGSAHRKYYEEQAKKHKAQEILPVEREVRRIEVEELPKEEVEIPKVEELPKEEEVMTIPSLKEETKVPDIVEEVSEITVEADEGIAKALDDVVNSIESGTKKKVVKSTPKTRNYNNGKRNYNRKNNNKK